MTRRGGVSTGVIAGLNCGFGADDDPAALAENRRRAANAVLPGATLVGLHQVHSAEVVTLDNSWGDDSRPHADGFVTRRHGVLLSILTADCAPVLFADMTAGVIGAAHAGWRGAHSGVLEATVEAMEALGADRGRIAAAIGPCIAQPSYEVDEGFRAQFAEGDERFFAPARAGHWQFDLPGYALARLEACGVGRAMWLGLDTYADADAFYSFRRSTHRGEPDYGRQLSLIGLDASV
ncbi:peptidoglycan editing factor PgeF [Tsuneonella mangrovi]|uniref:peptidoglycan editing factor PgeF n=1 Tax=Tsuneonella mangrovi TaxID=1982042 RepID=UPI001F0B4DDA|nr:peptidoglycan editing factor PgeF [Tsuneonella mangrovi]